MDVYLQRGYTFLRVQAKGDGGTGCEGPGPLAAASTGSLAALSVVLNFISIVMVKV